MPEWTGKPEIVDTLWTLRGEETRRAVLVTHPLGPELRVLPSDDRLLYSHVFRTLVDLLVHAVEKLADYEAKGWTMKGGA